jgi:low temperature requirement protein LtrA
MTSMLYSADMNKPTTMESVQPCSKQYSFRTDLKLNAWMGVAGLFWILSHYLIRKHPDMEAPLRVALALSPLVPGLLYVRSCMRFVRGLDELQRRLQLEALLFAALGTLLVATAINMLNANGAGLQRLPHGLELGGAFVLMFVLWVVGSVIASRRYK